MKRIFIITLIFLCTFSAASLNVSASNALQEITTTTYYETYDKGKTNTEIDEKKAKYKIQLKEKVDKLLDETKKEIEKSE